MGFADVIKELTNKTTIANVVAGVCVVMFVLYGVVSGNLDMIKDAVLIMVGYLFGRGVAAAR